VRATGTKHSSDLAECRAWIDDMLKDVLGENNIDRGVGEGQSA